MLKQRGFEVGAVIKCNKHCKTAYADEDKVYKIEKVTKKEIEAKEITHSEGGEEDSVSIVFEHLSGWSLFKGKVLEQVVLPKSSAPLESNEWLVDAAKGAVAIALRAAESNHGSDDLESSLSLWRYPKACRAVKPFKKGELTIVAATRKINTGEPKGTEVPIGKVADGLDTTFNLAGGI